MKYQILKVTHNYARITDEEVIDVIESDVEPVLALRDYEDQVEDLAYGYIAFRPHHA